MIDAHCRRGGKALVLNPSERGEMIVVKHGPREMQLAWTHLLPATFGGRARMNVQNALAAAAAAFATGAPLHDIRQGLRSFSTNYYLSPGRLNEVEVNGVNVIVDYCHNAPGMKMLGDFVDRVGDSMESAHDLARPVPDRRHRHRRRPPRRGHARARPHRRPALRRGRSSARTSRCAAASAARSPGSSTEGVRAAMAEGARCKQVESVLDEIEAVRHAMARANKGDLVVICVDKHGEVMTELENWSPQAQAGAGVSADAPGADPDYQPAAPAEV